LRRVFHENLLRSRHKINASLLAFPVSLVPVS